MTSTVHRSVRAAGADDEFFTPTLLPRRRWLRWVVAIVAIVIVARLIEWAVTNPAFQWDVVAKYLTAPVILNGLLWTIGITAVSFVFGFLLGGILAAMRMSRQPVLQSISWAYIWLFRSVPLLVQILLWFNISYLIPEFTFGVPFLPPVVSIPANQLISPLGAGLVALTLHEASYACEIVRGGLLSVDPGQHEAATALSLGRWRTAFHVVIPQAMRSILPAAGNQLIGLLKGSSMVSVIAVPDLLYSAQSVYNRTFEVMPLLVVASLWYIVVTSVLSLTQIWVEKRFSRGAVRNAPTSWWVRMRRSLLGATPPRTGEGNADV